MTEAPSLLARRLVSARGIMGMSGICCGFKVGNDVKSSSFGESQDKEEVARNNVFVFPLEVTVFL